MTFFNWKPPAVIALAKLLRSGFGKFGLGPFFIFYFLLLLKFNILNKKNFKKVNILYVYLLDYLLEVV